MIVDDPPALVDLPLLWFKIGEKRPVLCKSLRRIQSKTKPCWEERAAKLINVSLELPQPPETIRSLMPRP
jgi:hypothetical protein